MKPYYQDDAVTIYHGDCREILSTFETGSVDLVLTDPPYGIGWENNQRFSGGQTRRGLGTRHERIIGDDECFNPSMWLQFPRVILWGANHFWGSLPAGSALIWKKRRDGALGTFLSDAEIAYFNKGHGVYIFTNIFSGSTRAIDGGQDAYALSIHPNQKPVALMKWCIKKAECDGIILDPFMGSGTTLRAAKDLGRKAIGIEIEEKYCEIAAKRMAQSVMALEV